MNNEFISYEQALALKELGFDVFFKDYYYDKKGELSYLMYHENFANIKTHCPASLYQQVFRWFREKYCICSWVYQVDKNRYFFSQLKNGRYLITKSSEYNTYEEAELECLNKLIELVKNK
jgi:hypothetical protein